MYKSLQAGRSIAAILVVLFHLGGAIAAEKYFGIREFYIPFSFGSAGVQFFFVLSGFIILNAHRGDISRPTQLGGYISKRLIRIYPTYIIIFLFVYCLAIASPALRNTVPHDAIVILKSILLIPQDISVIGGSGVPVLGVAWTLQYEMLFYFFFAFWILNKWLLAIIISILLYIYIVYYWGLQSYFPYSFIFQQHIFLFVMGMLVSFICNSENINLSANVAILYAIMGFVIFSFIALDKVMSLGVFKEWDKLLYGVASSLIIFGLVKAEDKDIIIGGHRWMQILGDSSYALYLIHFPLISILCKFSLSIHLNKLGVYGAAISYATIFSLCLVFSVAFFLWIEKPLIRFLRNRCINKNLVA
jgi:peptidoglycan/LPS O-acetylase OafA/YrhL